MSCHSRIQVYVSDLEILASQNTHTCLREPPNGLPRQLGCLCATKSRELNDVGLKISSTHFSLTQLLIWKGLWEKADWSFHLCSKVALEVGILICQGPCSSSDNGTSTAKHYP